MRHLNIYFLNKILILNAKTLNSILNFEKNYLENRKIVIKYKGI